jgi:DNA-binding NtrC family response regulator
VLFLRADLNSPNSNGIVKGEAMRHEIRALLVHQQEGPFGELKPLLERQGITTSLARSCEAAKVVLARYDRPDLVFTETVLPDGTWREIVNFARGSSPPAPVIVVSRLACVQLFLDTLEGRASDFIVPPFRDDEIAHIVRSAILRRSQPASAAPREAFGTAMEVSEDAQDYIRQSPRVYHAQAGR